MVNDRPASPYAYEEQEFTPSKAAQKKYTSTESLSYAKAEKTDKPTKNQVTTTATLVDNILLLNDTDSDQEKKTCP